MVTQASSLVSQILALYCGLIAYSSNGNLKHLHGAEKPYQVCLDTKQLSDAACHGDKCSTTCFYNSYLQLHRQVVETFGHVLLKHYSTANLPLHHHILFCLG